MLESFEKRFLCRGSGDYLNVAQSQRSAAQFWEFLKVNSNAAEQHFSN